MHYAKRELCEELFKLTGLKTGYWHNWGKKHPKDVEIKRGRHNIFTNFSKVEDFEEISDINLEQLNTRYIASDGYVQEDYVEKHSVPAYGLGYLLRKLPQKIKRSDGQYGAMFGMLDMTLLLDGKWDISYRFEDEFNTPDFKYSSEAGTPENAACKLAIALAKANLIHKEGKTDATRN